jgi:hypothetical protein
MRRFREVHINYSENSNILSIIQAIEITRNEFHIDFNKTLTNNNNKGLFNES